MSQETEVQDEAIARGIGKAIAARREAAFLTQEQLAEALGVGVQQVSRFERGAVTPSVQRLYQVADALNCRVDEILMEASPRHLDQQSVLEHELVRMGPGERGLAISVLKLLTGHFEERSKKARTR